MSNFDFLRVLAIHSYTLFNPNPNGGCGLMNIRTILEMFGAQISKSTRDLTPNNIHQKPSKLVDRKGGGTITQEIPISVY